MDLKNLIEVLEGASKTGGIESELKKLSQAGAIQVIDLASEQQGDDLLPAKRVLDNLKPPTVEGHLPPSTTDLVTLTLSEYGDLDSHQRNKDTGILLRIEKVGLGTVARIDAADTSGAKCRIWSLIRQPFGQGAGALAEHSWIAIKEPFLGKDTDGVDCIRLDHPTDAVMVSRFGEHARCLPTVDDQSGEEANTDCRKAGNDALVKGQNLVAVECYTHAIEELISSPTMTDPSKFKDLYLKKAYAHTRCRNFTAAAQASESALVISETSLPALRLLCSAKVALGDWTDTRKLAQTILNFDPNSKNSQANFTRIKTLDWQHHCGGYDFTAMVTGAQNGDSILDIASFTGQIAKRKSSLGGQGMFAKTKIKVGELLLVEKPFALALPSDCTLAVGMKGLLEGETTSPRKMALLEKLADRVVSDPSQGRALFELWDGEGDDVKVDEKTGGVVFDSHRALRIINYNAHTIFPGPSSRIHDAFSPSTPPADRASCSFMPDSARLGLWLTASLFNHSCVPNASWSWIGAALIVRANRPIAEAEEVVISYTDPTRRYSQRQAELKRRYGFECSCAICVADSSISAENHALRTELTQITRERSADAATLQSAIAKTIALSYPSSAYLPPGLPCPTLALPLLLLAHQALGPVPTWASASPSSIFLATKALYSCLSLGLGVHVSLTSGRIFAAAHAQARGVGVWALIGLAELAFLDSRDGVNGRCGGLEAGARSMYRICYGEDASFMEKGREYACWGVEPAQDEGLSEKEKADDRGETIKSVRDMWKEWEEEGRTM